MGEQYSSYLFVRNHKDLVLIVLLQRNISSNEALCQVAILNESTWNFQHVDFPILTHYKSPRMNGIDLTQEILSTNGLLLSGKLRGKKEELLSVNKDLKLGI